MKILGLVASMSIMLASTAAFAKCDRYGNCYYGGGSGYSGHNYGTGNSWNSRSYGNSTSGTDSSGNLWTYNRNSGSYYNYGTGEYRYRGRKY